MKRSLYVPLIFLGTLATLTKFNNDSDIPATTEIPIKQDFYTSLEECQRDWGSEPQNCRQAMTTQNFNGQESLVNGYSGSDSSSHTSTSIVTTSSSSSTHTYSGPRYFWYRTENGGYPMTIDSEGKTRPVISSRIPPSGAQFATQTVTTHASMPTHLTASHSVIRGGFGGTGHGMSSGG
jgi:hypothetical protein